MSSQAVEPAGRVLGFYTTVSLCAVTASASIGRNATRPMLAALAQQQDARLIYLPQ